MTIQGKIVDAKSSTLVQTPVDGDAGPEADAIVCDRVTKHFIVGSRRIDVLDNLSFSIRPTEFVSLLGPSGCGKSTLLMILAGLESPTRGKTEIFGEELRGPYSRSGIVFQDPVLLPWKTALGNVLFPYEMKGQDTRPHQARALRLLEQTGLADASDRRPRQLSGGMRQRVALCRALIEDAPILFLDEPFSALDAFSRDEMNQVLLDIWNEVRKTAIFVTHSIREAALLSDRILVMGKQAGNLIADVEVPFARPRNFSLTTRVEFNMLCEQIRGLITEAHHEPMRAPNIKLRSK